MFVLTPEELTAIKLSIRVALVATLVSLQFGVLAAMPIGRARFSNRPFEVKRFQTIHHCSVYAARGLVLLSGIGTKALP